MTAVSTDTPGAMQFGKALSLLVIGAIESGLVTFDEVKVILGHEIDDLTFDECEKCCGEGSYFICANTGECDVDGCQRECECQ